MEKNAKTIPDALNVHLFHEGNYFHAYQKFGAHVVREDNIKGVRFTVWAPNAARVCVVGDFNNWQSGKHPLERITESGIWSLFIPGLKAGTIYKYEVHTAYGEVFLKADPFAFYSEVRPKTASVVYDLGDYPWTDEKWRKRKCNPYKEPMNIYEVHLGSWKQKENGDLLTYRELAEELPAYAVAMGYTHIELMPLMEHPLDASWGYQVTGFYSVTSRFGTPDDFRYFINACHEHGLGVIMDWVPAHFCRDEQGLSHFDGTPLYEAREILNWGTLQFDYAKPEVRSYLISNAMFWFDVYHIDGLRVDAVSSMLFPNYWEGIQWRRNESGQRESYEAVLFLRRLNEAIYQYYPNALMIAEESTTWPLVTKPTYVGGLGFNFKWNMGWMNDTLRYMELDCIYRKWHHNLLTFSMVYCFSENFILSLSHDEVVHGKRSLIDKMPGDYWQKFANLRLLMGYMMAHPGKKLLFMGGEFAQFIEWRFYESLEWKMLAFDMHRMFHNYIKELNHFYLQQKALWELDHDGRGFFWIDADNNEQSVTVFCRTSEDPEDLLLVVCNFTPVYREGFRIGAPKNGQYIEIFNSDAGAFGGSDKKNEDPLQAEPIPWHNQGYSLEIKLPPLAAIFLSYVRGSEQVQPVEEDQNIEEDQNVQAGGGEG
ncbi:MAG TPA: 1,4-alpha-glucan branching protein GlgB [Firmicutes bacterium]|jgi:1,4-alpha-glucan branching enzyme|nr:1,4-alpha-glucan branching protein GlgB [Bacillota bacterium]HOQ24847.1 1,4-alpha-glucan branching protein GlgB [Bacillota bacterium]HPT67952.1 1,4-alpha-glucan branching protein GlgB [Bacillota bacterium]